MTKDHGKKSAAKAAASYVKEGMILGVGTGSTVFYFIEELAKLHQNGLDFEIISSSIQSTKQAHLHGLKFVNMNLYPALDLTVDGADQIDHEKNMIKGGGGALLREKILAFSSKETLIIVDESKYVPYLQNHQVPVEILPFCKELTISRINQLGYFGSLRTTKNNHLFTTDNSNYIYDLVFENRIVHPEEIDKKLRWIPGVLETGFFFNLAKKVVIGYENGKVDIR